MRIKKAVETFALSRFKSSLGMVAAVATMAAQAADKPNFVYIMCDDLGYGDIQCLNPERGKIATPQVDALAKNGMTFTDAHSASAVCTPSRYALLTGRYSWRTKLQAGVFSSNKGGHDSLIKEDILTVPQLLKQAGYTTAAVGKWHLGIRYEDAEGNAVRTADDRTTFSLGVPVGTIIPNGPTSRGFDYFYGFHHAKSMDTLIENNKVVEETSHAKVLDLCADKAVSYLADRGSDKETPFFLYVALGAPHSPIVPSDVWQEKGISPYADFVMHTDAVAGRIIQAVDDNGLRENTIVVFTADNGCSAAPANSSKLESEFGHYSSGPFRGYKRHIWEGGHRVPFIVRWPAKVAAGSTSSDLIGLNDLMATCAEITGVAMPAGAGPDSISMLPSLTGGHSSRQDLIHHSSSGRFAIRKGKWKLALCAYDGKSAHPDAGAPEFQLYDMEADFKEENNVVSQNPEVVKQLVDLIEKQITSGRSTAGEPLTNDIEVVIYKERAENIPVKKAKKSKKSKAEKE
ncbi:sulfatase family protein [Persicirhabdus sediminis]|nr:arylsulfatase [Persicirhabdus sediminis]